MGWINEDSLPVHSIHMTVEAVSNTLDSLLDVDGISDVLVGDVGLEFLLALSTVFPLSSHCRNLI